MIASDLFDNGQIDYAPENYILGVGSASLLSGGLSLAASMHDYFTWDRFSGEQKAAKLQSNFEEYRIKYDPQQSAPGKWDKTSEGYTVILNDYALSNPNFASHIIQHEIKHITSLKDIFKEFAQIRYDFEKIQYLKHSERNAHQYSLGLANKTNIPARFWFEELKLMKDVYIYTGPIPASLRFRMVLYNIF